MIVCYNPRKLKHHLFGRGQSNPMKFGVWKRIQVIINLLAVMSRHRVFVSGSQDLSTAQFFILKAAKFIGSGHLQFPQISDFLKPSNSFSWLPSHPQLSQMILAPEFKPFLKIQNKINSPCLNHLECCFPDQTLTNNTQALNVLQLT